MLRGKPCESPGLTGFPDAVRAVFPHTRIQLYIVHMVRNSTKYVSYKDLKAVCRDLKRIYSAPSEEEALLALNDFAKVWDSKYPMIRRSWESHWSALNEFFQYPDDDPVCKIMYLAIGKANQKWTQPIRNWGLAINQLSIVFGWRQGKTMIENSIYTEFLTAPISPFTY